KPVAPEAVARSASEKIHSPLTPVSASCFACFTRRPPAVVRLAIRCEDGDQRSAAREQGRAFPQSAPLMVLSPSDNSAGPNEAEAGRGVGRGGGESCV